MLAMQFDLYLELICVEEFLCEIGVRRSIWQIQPGQDHP